MSSALAESQCLPMRDIEDGEWIWASLDSGSDAHTTPPQVDARGELKPSKNELVDIQAGNMEAAGSRLISFEGEGEDGSMISFVTDSVVSKTKKFVLSIGKMDQAGFVTHFDGPNSYVMARSTQQKLPVRLIGNTYYLRVRIRIDDIADELNHEILESADPSSSSSQQPQAALCVGTPASSVAGPQQT